MAEGIFDTHAHYDDDAFDGDREELISQLPLAGITSVVNAGADMAGSRASVELARRYPGFYAAVGVHPSDTSGLTEADMDELAALAADPKTVAIGEIGLDYHYPDTDRPMQQKWFIRQLVLARELDMPVVIHSRDAAKDTYEIIRAEGSGLTMDMHCFSYSLEEAKKYLDMGFYLGIGGVLTFKNARKLREVAEYAPLSQLLLETDCPYLSPEPHRGRRNSSLNLPYVVRALSEIKGMDREDVIRTTRENAMRFYRL